MGTEVRIRKETEIGLVSPGMELLLIGTEMELDSKRKVLSTPDLVESLLLPMDPSSILQFAKSGVVEKTVLQRSLSWNVWSSLVKNLSYSVYEEFSQKVQMRCPCQVDPHKISMEGFLVLE